MNHLKSTILKRWLALLTLVIGMTAVANAATGTGSNGIKVGELYYIFDDATNTATVTYETNVTTDNYSKISPDVVIPSTVTYNDVEYTVTGIAYRAFYYSKIHSVSMPASVKTIGIEAFYNCLELTGELVIPDGVTSIERWAFKNCSGLSGRLKLNDSLESIGESAFE